MGKEEIFKELVTKKIISVSNNRLKILNTMDISMYGSRAWAFTIQSLGLKKNKEYLFNLGHIMGEDTAKEFMSITQSNKRFLPKNLEKVENIIEITGFGVLNIKKNVVTVRKNHIIEIGKELYKNKSLICNFYRGVYSGFLSAFKNKIKLREVQCICKGDKQCIFSS